MTFVGSEGLYAGESNLATSNELQPTEKKTPRTIVINFTNSILLIQNRSKFSIT